MDNIFSFLNSWQIKDPMLELTKSLRSLQTTTIAFDLAQSIKSWPIKSPAFELAASIKSWSINNPAFEIAQSIKSLGFNNPALELAESIKPLQEINPIFKFDQVIKSWQLPNPVHDIAQSTQWIKTINFSNAISESFKFLRVTNPINCLNDSILALQKTNILMTDLKKNFQNNFSILSSLKKIEMSVDSVLKHYNNIPQYQNGEVEFHSDGTISLSEYSVTQVEITDLIGNIINEAFEKHDKKLNEVTDSILKEVKSIKESKKYTIINLIIFSIIFPIILQFLSPFINIYVDNFLFKNKKFFRKYISNQLITQIEDSKRLNYLRIITAKNIEVRSKASRKSEFIAYLKFGEIVFVINNIRDWSYIQKFNEDGDIIIQGWVFSRYLKKLK